MTIDATTIGTLVGYIAGVSVATERITEMVKNGIWKGLLVSATDQRAEQRRVAVLNFVAIAVGAVITWVSYDQVAGVLGFNGKSPNIVVCIIFGAMAAGGSGVWNSALDIVREVSKQKQKTTAAM